MMAHFEFSNSAYQHFAGAAAVRLITQILRESHLQHIISNVYVYSQMVQHPGYE
jgi:hypothetical protein